MRRAALDRYLRRAGRACRPSGERRGSCRGTCARPRYEARRSETARSADERSRRRQFRSVFLKCMATELRRERREKQKRKRQPRRSPQSSGILNQLIIGGVVVLAIVLGFAGQRAAGVFEPYPPLGDAKIALTSWGWILKLPSMDDVQLVQFVRAHYADQNYAPEYNVP